MFKHLQSIFSRKWREPHKDCLCASRLGFPTQGNYSSFPRCCISRATKDSHLTSQIVGLREPGIMSHGGHHWAKAANSHLWKERLELKRWYWNHLRVTESLFTKPCLNQQKTVNLSRPSRNTLIQLGPVASHLWRSSTHTKTDREEHNCSIFKDFARC